MACSQDFNVNYFLCFMQRLQCLIYPFIFSCLVLNSVQNLLTFYRIDHRGIENHR